MYRVFSWTFLLLYCLVFFIKMFSEDDDGVGVWNGYGIRREEEEAYRYLEREGGSRGDCSLCLPQKLCFYLHAAVVASCPIADEG